MKTLKVFREHIFKKGDVETTELIDIHEFDSYSKCREFIYNEIDQKNGFIMYGEDDNIVEAHYMINNISNINWEKIKYRIVKDD